MSGPIFTEDNPLIITAGVDGAGNGSLLSSRRRFDYPRAPVGFNSAYYELNEATWKREIFAKPDDGGPERWIGSEDVSVGVGAGHTDWPYTFNWKWKLALIALGLLLLVGGVYMLRKSPVGRVAGKGARTLRRGVKAYRRIKR